MRSWLRRFVGRRRTRVIVAATSIAVLIVIAAVGYRVLRAPRDPLVGYTPTPDVPSEVVMTPTPRPDVAPGMPPVACASATIAGVWAHQDDDLIFAEPDLADAVRQGDCVRSLYVTAGDAGRGSAYSRSRELGILRAYNVMRGSLTPWDSADIVLASGPHLTVYTPEDDPRFSVAFLRLPDGGLDGSGFPATGDESLMKLEAGSIGAMEPIDGGPPVTADGLRAAVTEVLDAWQPATVLTLIPAQSSMAQGDHPDHSAVGSIVRQVWQDMGLPLDRVRYYLGYPSKDLPVNVSGDALDRKLDVYRAYANYDAFIACTSDAACLDTPGFGQWLQRSYARTDGDLGIP